ncbi:winged helix-turn-helix transcriptional regulator [Nonomuraea turkmeniaca]|uniref:Winged helix-turn-helix transcriptional regulator n=1 Tax=Nonomuraea turkmeniaca TaxID=103838 RepID=A0A5S4FWJ6_9ACTN|nr:MarR family winged helix-turn-helix transcriptional regulator [Nonomuraea turkmeniaca]TMR25019.1 winged helix-turn-helix transcriptional regulator [Nonomuraea turkmeniaca]
MTAPVTPEPPDLMQLLTRAERLLGRRLAVILEAEGCSLEAWRVITLLSDGAGHHMTEIAEHAFLPPATLTKLLDHLVDEGLVYRRVDDLDRRRIRAFLTPRGRRLRQRVGRLTEASMVRLPTANGDEELLKELLARLVDSLAGSPVAEQFTDQR